MAAKNLEKKWKEMAGATFQKFVEEHVGTTTKEKLKPEIQKKFKAKPKLPIPKCLGSGDGKPYCPYCVYVSYC